MLPVRMRELIKFIWAIFLTYCNIFVVFCYRKFGSRENRRLLRKRIVHKIERIWKIISYQINETWLKIFGGTSRRPSNQELGTFLYDVLDKFEIWWKSRSRYMDPYIEFEEWMIASVFGRNIVNVKYTGSFRETIVSMHYGETSSDIDMMYIYRDFEVRENTLNTTHIQLVSSQSPGYVLLKGNCTTEQLVNVYNRIAKKGEFSSSLHVSKLMEYFSKEVLYKFSQGSSDYYVRSDNFRHMHELFNRERFSGWMKFQQQGPASTIVWNIAGLPKRQMLGEIDIVFSLHCPDWPSQANEWLKRRRNYKQPTKAIISKIEAYGVDIVPKSSKIDRPRSTWCLIKSMLSSSSADEIAESLELEWRLSFSVAEMLLIQQWNPVQKSCFRAMKTLRNDYLSKYGVKSYALKNIMFYMVEEHDEKFWVENKFITIMDEFFSRLIACCDSSTCKHYFVRRHNLFFSEDHHDLKRISNVCRSLLSNWHKTIYLSDGLWFKIKEFKCETYFKYLSFVDKKEAKWYHNNEKKIRESDIKRYTGSCKIYYSHKVQKEVMRFVTASINSPNTNLAVVMSALMNYIRSKPEPQKLTTDQQIIYSHVCWAYLKCVRYISKQIEDKQSQIPTKTLETTRRDATKWQELADRITSDYLTGSRIDRSIVGADLFLRGKIQESSEILENAGDISGIEEFYDETQAPVVLCAFDADCFGPLAGFQFKATPYYCPVSLIKALVEISKHNKHSEEIQNLLNQASRLWLDFPVDLSQHRLYYTVFTVLSKYLHAHIEKKLENK